MAKVLFVFLLMSSLLFAGVYPAQHKYYLPSSHVNEPIVTVSKLIVYPSPAKLFVNVETKGSAAIKAIRFYNILGTEVLYKSINGKNKIRLNINNFKRGKYLVRVYFSDGSTAYTNLVKA